MQERQETGQQAEQRIQGEAVAAEIARKEAAGEPLTDDEAASKGVQADKDAQAALEEDEARQAAAEGQVVGSEPGTAEQGEPVGESGETPDPNTDAPAGDTPPLDE